MSKYLLSEKFVEQLQYTASITITYGRGRSISHDIKNFKSREDAKIYAGKFLDEDENVARYTIHDYPIFEN